MGNISKISVDGETHQVKDAEARSLASQASSDAATAKENAEYAKQQVDDKISKNGGSESATTVVNFVNGLQVGGVPVSFNANTNEITFG